MKVCAETQEKKKSNQDMGFLVKWVTIALWLVSGASLGVTVHNAGEKV